MRIFKKVEICAIYNSVDPNTKQQIRIVITIAIIILFSRLGRSPHKKCKNDLDDQT